MANTRLVRADQRVRNWLSLSEAAPLVRLPYPLVARILAFLLLIAAALKLLGLGAELVSRLGIFASVIFQVAVIEAEIALGAWLLTGKQPVGSWLVSAL